jgi:DNA-binding CsgD family transcriptional regulator
MADGRCQDYDECVEHDRLNATVLRLIYEGALAERPWLALLKELRSHLQCSHANVAFHRRNAPGDLFDSIVDADCDSAATLRNYTTNYAPLDPIPYHRLVPGRVYLKHELWDAPNAFDREFLHPQGIDELAILLIDEPGGMRAWLTLARRSPHTPFSADDCEFIRALTPHFSLALRIFSALKSAETERDIYREAVGSFAIGTLLVDQNGCVARTDAVAARILNSNAAISIRNSRLHASDPSIDSELREAVVSAVKHGPVTSPPYSRVMRLSSWGSLSMLIRSIAAGASSTGEKTVAAVIHLSDARTAGAAGTASAQKLMELFELNTMEAGLALQIARGRTLTEAALALKLSEQTARTYSKQIFAKTGTHRQAELVRLILTSVAHLST